MSAEFLELFQENSDEILEESLPLVDTKGLSYSALLDICSNYHIKAITHLLLNYDIHKFKISLFKSGRTFLAGLKHIDHSKIATSKASPLFDAIACDDISGAVGISRQLGKTWNKYIEYKEDYLYVMFIMSKFGLVKESFEFEEFFDEYNTLLEGASDLRLDVLSAIYTHDQELFDHAILEYLNDYKSKIVLLTDNESISLELAATDGHICVAGILLLKLAEKEKINLDMEYPLIPFSSRKSVQINFDSLNWKNPSE